MYHFVLVGYGVVVILPQILLHNIKHTTILQSLYATGQPVLACIPS